jgi:hypothetical protein
MAEKRKHDPIGMGCRPGPMAAHNSGRRGGALIQFHVVHGAEGGVAAGVANYLHQPYSGGSTQRVVDDFEGIRILPDLLIPWGAPPLNKTGIHDELCSFSRWNQATWRKRLWMLRREGWFIARDCHVYRIPVRWLTAAQLKKIGTQPGKGKGGITDHVQVARAFGMTNHTDPGLGFEKAIPTAAGRPAHPASRWLLMAYAKRYYKQLEKGAKP